MKTLQIMQSPDRILDGVTLLQDTNGFFNATKFLDAYNLNHKTKKRLQNFLDNSKTKKFIASLQKELMALHSDWSEDTFKMILTRRGSKKGSWFNPYLFLKLCFWIDTDLEAQAHIFLTDKLILFRHQCGDGYKTLSKAIQERNPLALPSEYRAEAQMINTVVFGKPDSKQRNGATEEQLRLLEQVQKVDVKLMDKGLDYASRFKKLLSFREFLE